VIPGADPAAVPGLPGLGGAPLTPTDVVAAPDQPRRAFVEQIMGMPVSVHVRGPLAREEPEAAPPAPVATAVGALFAELRTVDTLFSTWQAGSEVSRIRRGELALADAHPLVREVAARCETARERTGGWFDAYLPDADGERRFEPTGLVKGWAVQRAVTRLAEALPAHDVLVNAGGDIAVRCRRTDTPDWALGIEDPLDRSRVLARVPLRTGGMATSGTAARGAHIVDPATGLPVTALAAVTVVGPDLLWADVHATAAFAAGAGALDYLAALAGHLAFVVRLDGTRQTVRGS